MDHKSPATVTHFDLDVPARLSLNRFQDLCDRLAELTQHYEFEPSELAAAGINLDRLALSTKKLEELTAAAGSRG